MLEACYRHRMANLQARNVPMQLRSLGKSDIRITPIGLGCWQFSNRVGITNRFWPALSVNTTRDIVQVALNGGINWFDTAEAYGWGTSEERLADALRAAHIPPGAVVVATKWHPFGRFAGHMVRSIGERRGHLGAYPIDLYQIHHWASFSTINSEARALAQLVERGDIKTAGISNYSAGGMRRMHAALARLGVPLVSNQVEYNLLKRRIESNGTLATAKELGITIIAYSPLAQGVLSGKFHDNPALKKAAGLRRFWNPAFYAGTMRKAVPLIAALKEIAAKYTATPSQVALNWVVNFHGDSVVAIPGATTVSQIQDNVGALNFQLTAAELGRLDELSRLFK